MIELTNKIMGVRIMSHYDGLFVYTIEDLFSRFREIRNKVKCINCGSVLSEGLFGLYEHDDGLYEVTTDKRYWIYFRCPNCDYDIALWKLFSQINPEELSIYDLNTETRSIMIDIDRNKGKIYVRDLTFDRELEFPMSEDINKIKDVEYIMKKGRKIEWVSLSDPDR